MNATTKVLFPVDFSAHAQQALKLAISLTRDHRGELLLLHVEESPLAYGGGEFYLGLAEPNHEELQKMLAEVAVDDPELRVTRHLVLGSPATAIVQFAERESVDYIVMPTHGRTGLTRLLMGSVAEEVVRRAPCPVLTVRNTAVNRQPQPPAKEHSHV